MGLTEYIHTPAGTRQRDLAARTVYDPAYLGDRYRAIDDAVWLLSLRRLQVLRAFHAPGRLLDYGCGTGRFVQLADAHGFDLVDGPGRRVREGDLHPGRWDTVTFFDSLEHLPDPAGVVRSLAPACVMVSVPWCHYPDRPEWFMPWKHRRPGEHLWHWNRHTLDRFFAELGYAPLMHSTFEDEFRPNPAQPEPNILSAVYRRRP